MLEGGRRAGVLALLALLPSAPLLSCERPEPSDAPWSEEDRQRERRAHRMIELVEGETKARKAAAKAEKAAAKAKADLEKKE